MTTLIGGLFGFKDAEKAQKLAREQQRVSQARQLSSLNSDTARTALIRRNPRGRRLFADASASQLPAVVA
jgi:hypothetical protein